MNNAGYTALCVNLHQRHKYTVILVLVSQSQWVILRICSKCCVVKCQKRLMGHLRDLQKHKISIYTEHTANLKTHLFDLILLPFLYSNFELILCECSSYMREHAIKINKYISAVSPRVCAHSTQTCKHTMIAFLSRLCSLKKTTQSFGDDDNRL